MTTNTPCPCSDMDWSGYDMTAPHHPDCLSQDKVKAFKPISMPSILMDDSIQMPTQKQLHEMATRMLDRMQQSAYTLTIFPRHEFKIKFPGYFDIEPIEWISGDDFTMQCIYDNIFVVEK